MLGSLQDLAFFPSSGRDTVAYLLSDLRKPEILILHTKPRLGEK